MTLIDELTYEILQSESLPWSMGDYIDGLKKAIKIVENHSDWIPASEPPKPNEMVCVKRNDKHYEFCVKNDDGQWVGQFGETYCDDEIIVWKHFEPYEGESNDVE